MVLAEHADQLHNKVNDGHFISIAYFPIPDILNQYTDNYGEAAFANTLQKERQTGPNDPNSEIPKKDC